MPMQKKDIKICIETAFPDAVFTLLPLLDDGDHWSLHIRSKRFLGKTRIQQHKMVHRALEGKTGTTIHALRLKTEVL